MKKYSFIDSKAATTTRLRSPKKTAVVEAPKDEFEQQIIAVVRRWQYLTEAAIMAKLQAGYINHSTAHLQETLAKMLSEKALLKEGDKFYIRV